MMYIHKTVCISPQHSYPALDAGTMVTSVDNQLRVIEPAYEGIPPGALRRMGKAVRIGVGAGLAALRTLGQPDGIIIGTGNGGIEDSIKFLDQIIEYKEGLLTPGNFVQSTANAIGSQISLVKKNKRYSCTHVHRGLAFENALLDAILRLKEHPAHQYLVGAVDEISAPNYNIDRLAGWFSNETFTNRELFEGRRRMSLAGEGAFMGIMNQVAEGAIAALRGLHSIHTTDASVVNHQLARFLEHHLPAGESIDLYVSGEDGDSRHVHFYNGVEEQLAGVPVARFKQLSGEYPTASSFGFWLACEILANQSVPAFCLKTKAPSGSIKNILLYNNYRGEQHAFYLITSPPAPRSGEGSG